MWESALLSCFALSLLFPTARLSLLVPLEPRYSLVLAILHLSHHSTSCISTPPSTSNTHLFLSFQALLVADLLALASSTCSLLLFAWLNMSHSQRSKARDNDRIEYFTSAAVASSFTQTAISDGDQALYSASGGLGLEGFSFSQPSSTPLLYTTSPDGAEHWNNTDNPSPVAASPTDLSDSAWPAGLGGFASLPASGNPWEQDAETALQDSLAVQRTIVPTAFPYGIPIIGGRPSHRPPLPACYRKAIDSYRTEDTEPIRYSSIKAENSWFDAFSIDMPSHSGSAATFVSTLSLPEHNLTALSSSVGISPDQLNTTDGSPFSSIASSPAGIKPHVLAEGDLFRRGISMPAETVEEQELYEMAVASVARTRNKKRRFTSPTSGGHRCNTCGKHFSRRHNLKNHQQQVHNKDRVKAFQCQWDGCKQAFTRPHDLTRHEKSVSAMCSLRHGLRLQVSQLHTKVKDMVCPACDQAFPRKDTLRR